ncbi:class I SAM-dependent methyltransferase [Ruegeria marina]|uniref:Ubiquinone/menaquinone biosynthesis C-methylase UbiE n=1 Tax=Ruegeria marina TaxID=639004 RepID=A0A1G6QKC5_9RHOB|nr:class I SAM-dependent methyltransferase [Ruegeria marina]SDC92738.1 Ubiquinone/menaquinone biosynthesis C-methylase UbiE [Ruegeria marina]
MGGHDEPAASGSFAERYDATLVPVIFRPWARELVRRIAPKDGDRILDLACGTGAVGREICASGIEPGVLIGADISEDMLQVARSRASEAGIKAEYLRASADDLPFPDHSFDVVFCQQALQFFPDRAAALHELKRVLVPGGRAAFCVSRKLELNPLLKAQAATLDRYASTDAGNAVRAICAFDDAQIMRRLFEDADMTEIEIESVTLTLSHPDGRAFAQGAMGGMHTGDKMSRMSAESRNESIEHFMTGLGDCFDGKGITFPHVSYVVTARA